jgi:hypothetical protein
MDEDRLSISPDALYHRLGSAAVGVRGVTSRHGRHLPLQDRATPDLAGMLGGWALPSLCRSGRMTPSRALAAAIALSLIILPSALEAQMLDTLRVDLSRAEPGQEPEGFVAWRTGEGGAARWVVVEDATASQGRAIAQMSNERTDYRFPLAVYKPFSGKNLEVRLRFKAVAGSVDEAGGIALRLNTPDDYYVVRANALEDNVRFYRVAKGRRTQIAGADTKVWQRSGTPSRSVPRANASRSRSTARCCSPPPTRPWPSPAKSRCGPKLTASRVSMRSRLHRSPDEPFRN